MKLGAGAAMGQVVPAPPVASRLLKLKEVVVPVKADSAFVAMNANVLGDVKIGANSSVWYGAILRGEGRVGFAVAPRPCVCGRLPRTNADGFQACCWHVPGLERASGGAHDAS